MGVFERTMDRIFGCDRWFCMIAVSVEVFIGGANRKFDGGDDAFAGSAV